MLIERTGINIYKEMRAKDIIHLINDNIKDIKSSENKSSIIINLFIRTKYSHFIY